ncbi:MAG: MG2 domain-containing protein [Prevotella sp.]|nr:MG2 domain-containing protein [Prevotella sp.]
MKHLISIFLIFMCLMPLQMKADGYTQLWKQYETAQQKDLPRTSQAVLKKIMQKATQEKAYGHLLSAQLFNAQLQCQISPDSATVEIKLLEAMDQQAKDPVVKAVYDAVIGKVYAYNEQLSDSAQQRSKAYFAKALQNPALLAKVTDKSYSPLVTIAADSKIFNHDLLHVIGFLTEDYATLYDYYAHAGNREAACYLSLLKIDSKRDKGEIKDSLYVKALDSLMNVYKDLPVAAEIAIKRYDMMNDSRITAKQKNDFLEDAISKWGTWQRANVLRNELQELKNPTYNVQLGEEMLRPNQSRKIKITQIRNLNEITMKVYRLQGNVDDDINLHEDKEYRKAMLGSQLLSEATQTLRYSGIPAYQMHADSVTLKALPLGTYLVEATTDNKTIEPSRALLRVSNLFVVWQELPQKKVRIAVVNATTGEPVPYAHITFKQRYGKTMTLAQADEKGEYVYNNPSNNQDAIKVYTEDDKAAPLIDFNSYFSYYNNDTWVRELVNLYTDRRIYRPGQTVHVAVLAYQRRGGIERSVLSGKEFKLTLRNANRKEVETKSVTTDEFGSASADFMLPTDGLTGTFSIASQNGSVYFNVEEYKRPTFEVAFDEYKEKYQIGDTITVTGHAKSYAGVPVQAAQVDYTITSAPSFWWFRSFDTASSTLSEGQIKTDEQGNFKVRVPLIVEKANGRYTYFYNIKVNAKVTDISGESHENDLYLPLSNKATAFTCNLPDENMLKDSLTAITFIYKNAGGKDIPGTVSYRIDDKNYTAKANEEVNVKEQIAPLKSGKHHFFAICGNDTIKRDFVVFSLKDKQCVIETHDWYYQSSNQFSNDGKPIYVQIGSSDEAQHVYYTLISGKNVLESGTLDLHHELYTREFSYKPEYENGLVFSCAWVKDGKVYVHKAEMQRPMPDKRLVMKWTTFRDKLTPGQQEEWTLNISRPNNKAAKAQLMATLYDKSLDQIRQHNWNFNLGYTFSLPSLNWTSGNFGNGTLYGEVGMKDLEVNDLFFSYLDDDLFSWFERNNRVFTYVGNGMVRNREVSVVRNDVPVAYSSPMAKYDQEAKADLKVRGTAMASRAVAESQEDKANNTNNQLRENLNETAFFYPNLETDAQGNVKMKFTLPESITTWRFMGLAHDKDLDYGMITAETVAKKTVMVQPNMPRFLRMGDHATISAKVFNTSSNAVSGVAKMELIDAETQKTVFSQSQNYTINPNGSENVKFSYQPAEGDEMLICKITANGKDYSDGEQHYLPILPDKELVTNTVPFTQNGAGTKTIDLSNLFPVKEASNRLTVEYTNNPAWLMVQALPYVGDVNDQNAISLAAAYYANSIGTNILHQSPAIKQTFELWKKETGKETSLMSSLEKNQDLKSMVLEETPWVMKAEKEGNQKQQLINFFDENSLSSRLNSTLTKLQKLQRLDGSFSWWPGMDGSPYMTVMVTDMMVRLNKMIGKQGNTASMLAKSFSFLDKQIAEEVRDLKKEEKKGIKAIAPSEFACNYLYCNALAGRPTTSDITYLLNLLMKQPTEYTIYGKANSAIIFSLYGKTQKAQEYLQSVNEYSVYKEEMGRYFDTPKAQYSWFDYKIPSQVAAIEAMKQIKPADKQTIEEMQRWLLQEKRTQCWDTPINSVDAIYAFLNGETDKLTPENNAPAILKVDGEALQTSKQTAALGYVKGYYQGADMRSFTAQKTTDYTSWGALYAQFMQKTTDVANASSGLTIKREILNEGKALKVGDKVKVRITITADRDYDFVQVQDKRAACMEPVGQLSGYHWGYYCAPKDNTTNYYFDRFAKGKHVVETDYYIDRDGDYQSGTCTVQCAYSPEFMAREAGKNLVIK